MNLTKRCDYAFRIIRAIYNSGDACIPVSEIAEREDIPYTFARSIQHDLTKGGLVKTRRGVQGGLMLDCDPKNVTLADIIKTIQGPISISNCTIDPDSCSRNGECTFHGVWQNASTLLDDYLSSLTLYELLNSDDPNIVKAT